jgi:hypothetical protein
MVDSTAVQRADLRADSLVQTMVEMMVVSRVDLSALMKAVTTVEKMVGLMAAMTVATKVG